MRVLDVSDAAHPVAVAPDLPARGTVYAVQFVGDRLYAATSEGGVQRWRFAAADPVRLQGLPALATTGVPLALSVDPAGHVAVATDAGEVLYWDRPDGPGVLPRRIPVGKVPLSSVLLDRDGTVLVGSHDGTLTRVQLRPAPGSARGDGRDVLKTFTSWVNAIARDGDIVLAGSSDTSLRLWRGSTDERGVVIGLRAAIDSIAFLDGRRVAVGLSGGEVDVVDLSREILWSGDGGVFSVAFAQKDARLIAASSKVDAWSMYDSSDLGAITRVGSPVPGGLPESALNGTAAVTPDGGLVVVGHRNGTVDGYQPAGASASRIFRIADHQAMPETLALTRDGHSLAVGGDEKVVRLYDVTTNPPRALPVLPGPTNYVLSVAFSPDGRLLGAASADGNTYLWRRTNSGGWQAAATLRGTGYAEACAFSADGRRLASAGADGIVHLWDVSDLGRPRAIGTAEGPSGDVFSLAFSTNGDLAAAAADKTVTVWRPEASTGQDSGYVKRLELEGLGQSAYSVAWATDGRTLAAGGAGGVLRVWDTDPTRARAEICAVAGTGVTSTEWGRLSPDQPQPAAC